MNPSPQLVAALRQHQSGQFGPAERLYREAIAANPGDAHALHLFGVLLHQMSRNGEAADMIGRAIAADGSVPDFHYNRGLVLWALGRRDDAMAHWRQVLAIVPDHAPAHMNLGNALREQGRAAEAVSHLRRAVELQPSPFAHNNLGLALAALGEAEAGTHYRRAIEMHPSFIEPYLNLALEFAAKREPQNALALVRRSLQIAETPDNKALFVRFAGELKAIPDEPGLRALVTRAVTEGWGPTDEIAPLVATLIRHGSPIDHLLRRAETPLDAPLTPAEVAALAGEPLVRWLISTSTNYELSLERLLTAARAALLAQAEAGMTAEGDMLLFGCVLARQCFINEYVFVASADELDGANRLRDALAVALANGDPIAPATVAIVAAYFPLHTIANAEVLLGRTWPGELRAVLDQQVRATRDEAAARAAIPQITPIEDAISRAVREMYEENPYPRWFTVGAPPQYDSIDALIHRERPGVSFARLGKGGDLDILVAGCGTGRQPIVIARQFPRANVLAIDLSTASLGYAKARADELGVRNITFGQADILALGSLGRTFDAIYAGGVLHHLGDPFAGWRVLLSLLRPNGFMHVALYSEIARRDIVAARAFIAARGYDATPQGIRAGRAALTTDDDAALRNVVLFNDFFTTSECRDLLFHVQEHRMTLPQIAAFLAASSVRFLGFDPNLRAMAQYAAETPDDPQMLDLARWHAFEERNPYAFASMYCFWTQKPA